MRTRRYWWLGGLAIAALIVVLASYFASSDPDGLERVADDRGFLGLGLPNPFDVLPDYTVPGVDGPLSTVLAGLIGVAVVFVLLWLIGRALARRG
jgi:hypothetical protein